MKAIQTTYRGIRYRSRTEARWAVFFEKLGIEAVHEGEGYDLGGTRYLCDFWLPAAKLWVEVKGIDPSPDEIGKASKLASRSGRYVVVAIGHPTTDDSALNLLMFGSQHHGQRCQFVDYGPENVFISDGSNILGTVKGSASDLGGAPYAERCIVAARAAQAERFGVHD